MKRGQITVFIILGLVILISIMLILVLTSQEKEEPSPTSTQEAQKINVYVQSCLEDVSTPLIQNITRKGGTLNRSLLENITYQNITYPYHCRYETGKGCVNELITRTTIEEELNKRIREEIQGCVNLSTFEETGYTIEEGTPSVSTNIGVNEVFITIDYPIRLSKFDFSIRTDDVSIAVESFLGYLFDLRTQILNSEIKNEFFDIDKWMKYNGDTLIERYRPYPDTVYKINRYNTKTKEDEEFKFAIEGLETVEFVEQPYDIPEESYNGYCITPDHNCHFNPEETGACNDAGGEITHNPSDDQCIGTSRIMERAGKELPRPMRYLTECSDGVCNDCPDGHKHGESWCYYEDPAGNGWDTPGSRHYVKKCFDGKIILEPCRDYREEICVEDDSMQRAICKPNRWEDCAAQTNEADCEDKSLRDCSWTETLADTSTPTFGIKRQDHLCHPEVPPGSKHWILPVNDVCQVASEYRECDGFYCPSKMYDKITLNCMYQGDCGASRNLVGTFSDNGFLTVNQTPIFHSVNKSFGDTSVPLQGLSMQQQSIPPSVFDNPEGTPEAIMTAMEEFIDEASGWDACDFCDCVAGVPVGDCSQDKLITYPFLCLSWEAPDGASDCEQCQNMTGPCTEYRCKSIGKQCIYEERNGFGFCKTPAPDTTGPEINSINATGKNTSFEYNPYSMWEDINSKEVNEYWLCNEDCDDDFIGNDGIEANSRISISFNLSEPAKCKVFPLPIWEYDDIPLFATQDYTSTFNTSYTYTHTIRSTDRMKEYLESISSYSSFYMLINATRIDNLVWTMTQSTAQLLDDFGEDPSPAYELYNNFSMGMLPEIEEFLNPIQEGMFRYIAQTEAKQQSLFIKCKDRSGNVQEEEYLIKYSIAQDRTPPKIRHVYPANTSSIDNGTNVTVRFNEPIQCKYDYEENNFSEMTDHMDCPISIFDIFKRGYSCTMQMEFEDDPEDIFISCLDQPAIEYGFNITLQNTGSGPSSMIPQPPGITNYIMNETDSLTIRKPFNLPENWTLAYSTGNEMNLELNLSFEYDCRYSNKSEPFTDMHNAFLNYGERSITTFENIKTTPETKYIRCIRRRDVTRNEGNYNLQYSEDI